MRADAIGLFWQDLPAEKRGGQRYERPMPTIPETGWKPSRELPNLSKADAISFDVETYDPELTTHGPGWARGRGHIVGVAIGVVSGNERGKWYFPIRHETEGQDNWPADKVLSWLRLVLADPRQMKVGANLQYDIGWLRQEGVNVAGELFDVQYAEALLEESAEVALETLGQKYLGEGKESNRLYEWLSQWFGGDPGGKQRKHIYRAPPCLVGPYAESDADLPLRLAAKMWPLLKQEGLLKVVAMENALIPLMVDMRFAGVSVDVSKAEWLRDELESKEKILQDKLDTEAGQMVNVNAADDIASAFDKAGLAYARTAKGNPSFTKQSLSEINHPLAKGILDIRRVGKLRSTFVESYILDSHIDGRLYGQFHQLRGEGGGTRSGRFSSSQPNLQNIPSRDDELAPLIRGLFIPDDGHKQWVRNDYSQIEYRFLAHFAVGEGADSVRQAYRDNPDIDYHTMVQEMVRKATGVKLARKPTKNLNFGLIYGMGVAKMAASLGLSKGEGKQLFDSYHKGAPFARATMDSCIEFADRNGYIETMTGRRSRFNLWEPSQNRNMLPALPQRNAIGAYGPSIKRAYTFKALNRKLQGSAADLMKMAMLKCYQDGIFDETGIPRLTVHDELDFSDPGGKDEAFDAMRNTLQDAIQLDVPVRASYEVGPDWGHCEEK